MKNLILIVVVGMVVACGADQVQTEDLTNTKKAIEREAQVESAPFIQEGNYSLSEAWSYLPASEEIAYYTIVGHLDEVVTNTGTDKFQFLQDGLVEFYLGGEWMAVAGCDDRVWEDSLAASSDASVMNVRNSRMIYDTCVTSGDNDPGVVYVDTSYLVDDSLSYVRGVRMMIDGVEVVYMYEFRRK